jgi:hypothetical protein
VHATVECPIWLLWSLIVVPLPLMLINTTTNMFRFRNMNRELWRYRRALQRRYLVTAFWLS